MKYLNKLVLFKTFCEKIHKKREFFNKGFVIFLKLYII